MGRKLSLIDQALEEIYQWWRSLEICKNFVSAPDPQTNILNRDSFIEDKLRIFEQLIATDLSEADPERVHKVFALISVDNNYPVRLKIWQWAAQTTQMDHPYFDDHFWMQIIQGFGLKFVGDPRSVSRVCDEGFYTLTMICKMAKQYPDCSFEELVEHALTDDSHPYIRNAAADLKEKLDIQAEKAGLRAGIVGKLQALPQTEVSPMAGRFLP